MLMLLTVSVMLIFVSGTMAAGNISAGKIKAASCVNCHGKMGEGKDKAPKLAGLDEAHLIKQLQDFKSGARKDMMMNMFAGSLGDMEIADLAAYYSSLK